MLGYWRANKLRTTLQTRSAAERDAIYAPARHGSWHPRILYYTIQNYIVLYYLILNYTILYSIILYYTIRSSTASS